jgi:hypothetical protein
MPVSVHESEIEVDVSLSAARAVGASGGVLTSPELRSIVSAVTRQANTQTAPVAVAIFCEERFSASRSSAYSPDGIRAE